ncbi:MAG: Uma2 family endonuclease [Leptolyngbyaceae cyanobacterium bins.302]|nr:Uma2 family endonuclease [Leptolyngbyaceae cyanobacterium bins.302]
MGLSAQDLEALMPDASQLLSDEPEMESSLHYAQLALLVACLEFLWRDRIDFFIGANLTIYFSRQQLKNRDFRGPDFFLVQPTQPHPRNSWVVWEEDGKYPNLIIELLSASTADSDRTLKKALYQDRFRTLEYFWFSPETLELAGFQLVGRTYEAIAPTPQGWLWSNELGLYLGVSDRQLRYFSPTGERIPTPAEAAIEAQQAIEQELQAKQAAEERANRLAEQLRSLGVNPNEI